MKKYLKEVITHPLFSGSAIMVIGSNSVNALNYLYHLIVGRLLGPSGYGELASLLSIIGLLGMLPGSINLVVIKYISATKDQHKLSGLVCWLKSWVFKATLIFVVFLIIISPLVSAFLHLENQGYLILIAVSFLFSVVALLNRAVLQGLLKFKEMILSLISESLARLLITILLVIIGFNVGGAMWAIIISTAIGWFVSGKYISFSTGRSVDIMPELKSMAIYTLPVFIQTIAITSLYSTDLILVKHFFTSHEAGLYASLSILGKIIFFGTGPIGSVMFPIISQKHAHGQSYKRVFIYSFLTTLIISLGVLCLYLLVPEFAVNLLYGKAYLEAANLLVWFGLFITLFTLSSLLINFNLSLGRSSVVVLPFIAALSQIVIIWIYHQSLFNVILISIVITALLFVSLLIYSIYATGKESRNKANLINSASL